VFFLAVVALLALASPAWCSAGAGSRRSAWRASIPPCAILSAGSTSTDLSVWSEARYNPPPRAGGLFRPVPGCVPAHWMQFPPAGSVLAPPPGRGVRREPKRGFRDPSPQAARIRALRTLRRRKGRQASLLTVYAFVVFISLHPLSDQRVAPRKADLAAHGGAANRGPASVRRPARPCALRAGRSHPGLRASRRPARVWGYYYDALTKANYTLLAAARAARSQGCCRESCRPGPTNARSAPDRRGAAGRAGRRGHPRRQPGHGHPRSR